MPARKAKSKDDDAAAQGAEGSGYSITAIERAFKVLNAFSQERSELTLTDLVALTGLPKTTTFRLLSTLVGHDFCTFDSATGRYSLGFAVLRLGEIRRRQGDAHRHLIPVMREIRDQANETVVLSIRVGDERIHIEVVEAMQPIRQVVMLGSRAPLYTGAASKLLLSAMPDDEIDAYFDRTRLEPMQGTTITDADKLRGEIAQIREAGFAESRGELIPGGVALAAPVRDYSGRIMGALGVLTPSQRYDAKHRKRAIAALVDGAARASRTLGYRGQI